MPGFQDLYEQTKRLWTPSRAKLAQGWAKDLEAGISAVETASENFHEWAPLRFYVSVGKVRSATRAVTFSLRYRGQEVAEVKDGAVLSVSVKQRHVKANLDHFGVATPAGVFPWRSPEAAAFRKKFAKPMPAARTSTSEHELEAQILSELEVREGALKFGGTLKYVRHCGVTRHEYPLQFPVPLAANKGHPEPKPGHVDILVRQRRGPSSRLAVWELKKEGKFQSALAQAFIYAVELVLMLRGPGGDLWYGLLTKSKSAVPAKLDVEAVAVVSLDQRRALAKAMEGVQQFEMKDERATVHLRGLLYEPGRLRMTPVVAGS